MDRGFLYGDGAFETIGVINGKPILFAQHLSRLKAACELLKLRFDSKLIESELFQLASHTKGSRVAKIIITRGVGGRGYKPSEKLSGTRVIQLFDPTVPAEDPISKGISITLCQHRLSQSYSLAGVKHLNRLDQVLASAEVGDEFYEGLCMDLDGNVIEGTKSNVLLFSGGAILTPDLCLSGVKGIMLIELSRLLTKKGFSVKSRKLSLDDVLNSEEIILCNSVLGVAPVIKFSGGDRVKHWPIGDFCQQAIQLQNEVFA